MTWLSPTINGGQLVAIYALEDIIFQKKYHKFRFERDLLLVQSEHWDGYFHILNGNYYLLDFEGSSSMKRGIHS